MRFKFGLEKLLSHQRIQEEIAKRDYFDSLSKLAAQNEIYDEMKNSYDKSYENTEELKKSGQAITVMEHDQLEEFRKGQVVRMQRQMDIIDNFKEIVQAKQDVLIQAAREVKTLEKLREKKFLEFRKTLKKKELKANDEVVITRFKAGGGRHGV